MSTTRCCKLTADEMGVAKCRLSYSRDSESYQAGGFNFGRVHDPVYVAVQTEGHTAAWLGRGLVS